MGNTSHGWVATIDLSDSDELDEDKRKVVAAYQEKVAANEEKLRRGREIAGRLGKDSHSRR